MIYQHLDGYEYSLFMRRKYGWEIEFLCANSQNGLSLDTVNAMMKSYKRILQEYPENVLIKESESHTQEEPYYEASFFLFKEELEFYILKFHQEGLTLDIIHNHDKQECFDFNAKFLKNIKKL